MPFTAKSLSRPGILLLALLLILAVFHFRRSAQPLYPITYRIGSVDERFGLTRRDFEEAVNQAAVLWGEPLSRQLFREDSQGQIEVNLVYDYRQEITDRLKKIDDKLDGSKSSFESLDTRLSSLKMEYDQKNASLSGEVSVYQGRLSALNGEIQGWNRRVGIPESIRLRLTQEKEDLNRLQETLLVRQKELRSLGETINWLVAKANETAAGHNLDLQERRNTGNALGREFCEGLYEARQGRQTITIYQFDDESRLVRVLAHEFGHALGLSHSQREDAVMYRLIKSKVPELTPDDVAALKKQLNAGGERKG
jgi:hypothetical protein